MQTLEERAGNFGMIFVTGLSQLDILNLLTSQPRLPWSRVNGFRVDTSATSPETARNRRCAC